MKSLIILTVMTAALVTSACGSSKSSKKKEDPHHVFHSTEKLSSGLCLEVVQEDLTAKGFLLPDDAVAGACPATTVVQRVNATRYATCPYITDEGAPVTAVVYTKFYNEDAGQLLDMTVYTPADICSEFSE